MTDTFKRAITTTRRLLGLDIPPKPSPPLWAEASSHDLSPRRGSKRKATASPYPQDRHKRTRYLGNFYEEADLYEGSGARNAQDREARALREQASKHPTSAPNTNGFGTVRKVTFHDLDLENFKQVTQDNVENITETIMDSNSSPDMKVDALREVVEELAGEARQVNDVAGNIFEMTPEPLPEMSDDIVRESIALAPAPTTQAGLTRENRTPWHLRPNSQARKILADVNGDVKKARRAIQKDYQQNSLKAEPEYAHRDSEIRDGLWQVMGKMEHFAKQYFDFKGFNDTPKNCDILREKFSNHLQPETIQVIGFVASGGPSGEDGWRELFFDRQKRRALVCAIIGNVICEQVYEHAFFGGRDGNIRMLEAIQIDYHNEYAFHRNRLYAEYITAELGYKPGKSMDLQLPSGFDNHVQKIVAGIDNHLEVFRELSDSVGDHKHLLKSYVADLSDIIAQAGILSLLMRMDPHTSYACTAVSKDDSFHASYMECFNSANMESEDPSQRTEWGGVPKEEIKMRKDDEAVIQIRIMKGVTAYRVGGWEKSNSTPWAVKYEDRNFDEKRGIRNRMLTRGWVFCRWGRPKTIRWGTVVTSPRVHGSAWRHNGFVEFADVDGVQKDDTGKDNRNGIVMGKGKAKAV